MIHRIMLLVVTLLALSAQTCFGVGMGELELRSALNQQFSAEIELTNTRSLEIEELLPNLGSQADFDRIGVERGYALIDLRFKIVAKEDGKLVIQVTSSKPIIEPFLNFIVEILWPTGRILREYTVLLDPPVFTDSRAQPVAISQSRARTPSTTAPEQTPPPKAATQSPVTTSRTQTGTDNLTVQPSVRAVRAIPEVGRISGSEYGVTGAGDTLWGIALKVRTDK